MDLDAVPQEGNVTLGGHRKAVYARDASGRIQAVASTGWEVEEIVTSQAADALRRQAEDARLAVQAGTGSPLTYWMYERRMDVALLSQTSGFWQWRVKRHLRPEVFARLQPKQLERYADALGLAVAELQKVP